MMTTGTAQPAKVLLTEHDQEYIWVAVCQMKAIAGPSAARTVGALTDILRRSGWEFPE